MSEQREACARVQKRVDEEMGEAQEKVREGDLGTKRERRQGGK